MSWEFMQNGFLRLILFSPFSFVQPRVTNESDIFLSFTVNLNLIMSRRIHLGSYHVSVCLQVFVQ